MYSFRSISACPKQVNANRLDSSISFVLTIYDQPAALAFRLRPGMATNYKFATILPPSRVQQTSFEGEHTMKTQILATACLLLAFAFATAATAQVITYPGGRTHNRQIGDALTRVENKTPTFRSEVMRSYRDTSATTNRDDRIDNLIDRFNAAENTVRSSFNSRTDASAEMRDLLDRAAAIDRFMSRNSTNYRAVNQWNSIKTDLDSLARSYNISWDWSARNGDINDNRGGPFRGGIDARLTGTYRLNSALSDNVSEVLDRTFRTYSSSRSSRPGLERRMTSPEMLAIEKQGSHVTMASTLSPQVTFDTDGIPHSETNARGRQMTTTVSSDRNGMTIRYQGETSNDFNLVFMPLANGQLRVTRTLYLASQNQTVTVNSVYDKIDQVAQWERVNTGSNVGSNTGPDVDFIVPNGTRLMAQLESRIGTRLSQPGDRFTMRVTSPGQYRGAIIEGHVATATASDRLTGKANISLDFDRISLNDGRSYRFEGTVDSVRSLSGESLTVDNEGTVRDRNQTTRTATRTGIGAVIGALIGAATGGGEGAAVGAAVGAGVGAGSVLIQGRDNIILEQGSQFALTASAPASVGSIR